MTAKTKDPMPTRALAPWFGSGRLIAPLIRELYDMRYLGRGWNWLFVDGRTQTNETKQEVLIINGPSRAKGRLFE